jgi:RNA polymerase sigma-70 factor, ECF subfamily
MSQDDNRLIKQAQKGNQKAFEELILRYDKHVLSIAASFRNSEEDAKDIYQEVFLRVYKGLKNFQFRSEFSTWLYRITTNVCITYKSKTDRQSHDSLDREIGRDEDETTKLSDFIASEDQADNAAVGSDISRYINNALDTLPNQQRMAFTLKFYEGYKIREISDMMNCTDGTVKRYLFTATNKMREKLGNVFKSEI